MFNSISHPSGTLIINRLLRLNAFIGVKTKCYERVSNVMVNVIEWWENSHVSPFQLLQWFKLSNKLIRLVAGWVTIIHRWSILKRNLPHHHRKIVGECSVLTMTGSYLPTVKVIFFISSLSVLLLLANSGSNYLLIINGRANH